MPKKFVFIILILVLIIIPAPNSHSNSVSVARISNKSNNQAIADISFVTQNITDSFIKTAEHNPSILVFSTHIEDINGKWKFYPKYPNGTIDQIVDADAGDIDGDGKIEVAVLTSGGNIYLASNGTLRWVMYASLPITYNRISILDVSAVSGKEIVVWGENSGEILVISAEGFPLIETNIESLKFIVGMWSGDINSSLAGNEVAIIYYDSLNNYRLLVENLDANITLYNKAIFPDFSGETNVALDLEIKNISSDAGNEVIVGGVPTSSGNLELEFVNASGGTPNGWNETMLLGLSGGWIKLEESTKFPVVVHTEAICVMLRNNTDWVSWNMNSTEKLLDATISQDGGSLIFVWQPDIYYPDIYIGLASITNEVKIVEQKYICSSSVESMSVYPITTIIVGSGSYILRYNNLDLKIERKFLYPWNIESTQKIVVLYSESMLIVLRPDLNKKINYSCELPSTINLVTISDDTIVIAEKEISGNYKIVGLTYEGRESWSIDSLSIGAELIFVSQPIENKILLAVLNQTDNSTDLLLLSIDSRSTSDLGKISFKPQLSAVLYRQGEYYWILSEFWGSKIYVYSIDGRLAGIKYMENKFILDIRSIYNNSRIAVYFYDYDSGEYGDVMLGQNLEDILYLEGTQTPLVLGDINGDGVDELMVITESGNRMDIYSKDAEKILEIDLGRTGYAILLPWIGTDNTTLITISNSAKKIRLTRIENISGYIETIYKEKEMDFYPYTAGFSYAGNSEAGWVLGQCRGSLARIIITETLDMAYPNISIDSSDITPVFPPEVYVTAKSKINIAINVNDDYLIEDLEITISMFDKENNTVYSDALQITNKTEVKQPLNIDIPQNVYRVDVVAEAIDTTQKVQVAEKTIYVDRSAPIITPLFPKNITMTNNTELNFIVTDDTWIKNVYAIINGDIYPLSCLTYNKLEPGTPSIYSLHIPTLKGNTEVDVIAEDYSGRSAIYRFNVYYTSISGGGISAMQQGNILVLLGVLLVGIAVGGLAVYFLPRLYSYIKLKIRERRERLEE